MALGEDVVVVDRQLTLPGIETDLTLTGNTIVVTTGLGVRGSIILLAGVVDVGTDAVLDSQMLDRFIFGKGSSHDTEVLGEILDILQVTDRVGATLREDALLIVVTAIGIVDRNDWRIGEGLNPGVRRPTGTTRVETILLGVGTVGIDAYTESFENLTLVVDTTAVTGVIGAEDDTLLTFVTTRDGITALVVTTHDAELVLLLESSAESCIGPIVGLSRFGQEVTALLVGADLVIGLGELPGIKHLDLLADGREAEVGGIVDIVLATGTLLGGNHDDTIGTTRTVNGCGRDIFEDLDALDVRGIQERERVEVSLGILDARLGSRLVIVDDETVDDIERFVATRDGVAATDTDVGSSTWLTRSGADIHAGNRTREGRLDRRRRQLQVVGIDTADGSGELSALLGTVTDYDNLLQGRTILREGDGDRFRIIVHIDLLILITDKRNQQNHRQLGLCLEDELSVNVGDDTALLGTFGRDRSTRERFVISIIYHLALDLEGRILSLYVYSRE